MAKKSKKAKSAGAASVKEPRLLEQVLAHIEELYVKREKRFMEALEDSGRSKITLHFDAVLDLSESSPVVDTILRFKDKVNEGGMEVTKTFKAKLTAELDDPNQPMLPGTPERGGKDAASNPDED